MISWQGPNSLVAALLFFVTSVAWVRAEEPTPYKRGADLTKALKATTGFAWTDRPLAEGLQALSRNTSVAILLDRRVDPQQRITFTATDMPFSEAMKDLTSSNGLSVGLVGSVVYIAPKNVAPRIQALAAMRRREAAELGKRKALLEETRLQWEDLDEPKELIARLGNSAGAHVEGLDIVPHDVWPAWHGPMLPPVDQFTLLLAGFDLTFEFADDASSLKIVSAPRDITYEQTYEVAGNAAGVVAELRNLLPEIQVQREGVRVRVKGTAEDHEKVADLLAGRKTTTRTVVKPGEKRYTFTVKNELVGAILKTIAKAADLEVKADPEIVERLRQRISVEAKELTLEEALKKVLSPVGVNSKVTDKTIELSVE